jgi:hypothetical protein
MASAELVLSWMVVGFCGSEGGAKSRAQGVGLQWCKCAAYSSCGECLP